MNNHFTSIKRWSHFLHVHVSRDAIMGIQTQNGLILQTTAYEIFSEHSFLYFSCRVFNESTRQRFHFFNVLTGDCLFLSSCDFTDVFKIFRPFASFDLQLSVVLYEPALWEDVFSLHVFIRYFASNSSGVYILLDVFFRINDSPVTEVFTASPIVWMWMSTRFTLLKKLVSPKRCIILFYGDGWNLLGSSPDDLLLT